MATILLIDGNPEQRRALSGLLQYRTAHSVVSADDLVAGAGAVASGRPDLILINALLFMMDDYAFCRVLRQDSRTRSIPVAVHTATPLGELAERRIRAQGATGIIEMPASTDELTHHIEGALEAPRQTRREVRPVQWPTSSPSSQEGAASSSERAKPEARTQDEESRDGRPVRPVDWNSIASNRGNQEPTPPVDRPQRTQAPRRPAKRGGGAGSERGQGQFRASQYEAVDPAQAKAGAEGGSKGVFRQSEFQEIDPNEVKKRPRGADRGGRA